MIRPIIAIVGRPNVGKSTLFNRLVGRRQALVRDVPGVTRDRLYGRVSFERWQATVVDTGGFDPSSEEPLIEGVRRQVLAAVEEADLVVFVVDTRAGRDPALDIEIARSCGTPGGPRAGRRQQGRRRRPGGAPRRVSTAWASAIRYPSPPSTGAASAELLETVRARAPAPEVPSSRTETTVHVAIVGRPNVGKSSLVNADGRRTSACSSHAEPGTTRDAVDTTARATRAGPSCWSTLPGSGARAACRRRSRSSPWSWRSRALSGARWRWSSSTPPRASPPRTRTSPGIPTRRAAPPSSSSTSGIWSRRNGSQGRGRGADPRPAAVPRLRARLLHVGARPRACPSSSTTITQVAAEARRRIPGSAVTAALRAGGGSPPGSLRGDPLAIQSASQVAVEPPTFALRVNRPDDIHFSYERYLVKSLRHAFGLAGSPIRLSLRKATGSRSRPRRVRR